MVPESCTDTALVRRICSVSGSTSACTISATKPEHNEELIWSSAVACVACGGEKAASAYRAGSTSCGSDPGSQCTSPAACRSATALSGQPATLTCPPASSSSPAGTPSSTLAAALSVAASLPAASARALVSSGANRDE